MPKGREEKRKKKLPTASHDLIIEISNYQRWLAERHERSNEAISSRATTILGFLGVEIAIFAVISPKSFSHPLVVGGFGFFAAIFVLSAVIFLFRVLWAKEFHWPSEDIAREAGTWPEDHQLDFLNMALYSPLDSSRNIFTSLRKENDQLVKDFHRAIVATALAQVTIVLMLTVMWILIKINPSTMSSN